MKRLGYQYEVKVEVEFTKEELAELMENAARHYDATCRAAGKEGGFLYGFAVSLNLGIPTVVVDSRQLGLIGKIMEMSPITNVREEVFAALNDVNSEFRRLNPNE